MQNTPFEAGEKKLVIGYGPSAKYLTDNGYPVARSSLAKYCSPAIATGPKPDAYYLRQPAFDPDVLLAWAKSRLRPVEEARQEMAATAPPATAASAAPGRRRRGRPPKPRTSPPVAPPAAAPARTGLTEQLPPPLTEAPPTQALQERLPPADGR